MLLARIPAKGVGNKLWGWFFGDHKHVAIAQLIFIWARGPWDNAKRRQRALQDEVVIASLSSDCRTLNRAKQTRPYPLFAERRVGLVS